VPDPTLAPCGVEGDRPDKPDDDGQRGRASGAAFPVNVRERDIVRLAAEAFDVRERDVDRADVLATVGHEGRASKRFLKLYATRFGVNIASYKWWFHHRDDGVFAMPLVAVDRQGNELHIPLAAGMLADFAGRGRWEVDYPPHRLALRSAWWAVVVFGICALGLGYALFIA
jgi:hypothetical protein